jgi:hypothetical protein
VYYGIFVNGKLHRDAAGKPVVLTSTRLVEKAVELFARRGIKATVKVWEEEFGGGAWVEVKPTPNPTSMMNSMLYGPAYTPPPTPRVWRDL